MFHLQGNRSDTSNDSHMDANRLREMGAFLKRTREEKGIGLEAAVHATKIRSRYLLAIEEGEFEVLPGNVYARGFVRGYANYLGLDGEKIAQQYMGGAVESRSEQRREESQFEPPRENQAGIMEEAAPFIPMLPKIPSQTKPQRVMAKRKARSAVVGRRKGNSGTGLSSLIMWVAGIILLLTAAIVVYNYSMSFHSQSNMVATGTQPPSTVASSTVSSQTKIPSASQPIKFVQASSGTYSATYNVITTKPLQVAVKAVAGKCWFEVKADGKVIEPSLTLQKGQMQVWMATSNMQLLVGDSLNISMTINGANAPLNRHANGGYTYMFVRK